MNEKNISFYRGKFEDELYKSVLPFWENHSPDHKNGGFYNCLDEDGSVYDTRKHIWLQGRQTWLFSKLYNTAEKNENWLLMAKMGAEFLAKHAKREDGRVFFSVTEQGEGLWMQRKVFSECFYVMALAEYSRASGEEKYANEAKTVFKDVWRWAKDLSLVGRPTFKGMKDTQGLAIPMILLNLIEEIASDDWQQYRAEVEECIDRMLLHVHPQKKLVYETVTPEGKEINDIDGRLLNPGHAIEAGWFLQHWAKKLKNEELSNTAVNMVRWSFEKGWDNEFGGLYYFLDSRGYSPTQLEWDMKLWWPHTEAMYAHLLNYTITGEDIDWKWFEKVTTYTFDHFPDEKNGEWYGYLNRKGERTHRFKGGPYKGCFHVPRALLLCLNVLNKMK
ncbi:MAG: AGE family epimerase/isomerase [Gracilimonas sp.]|nr:AGE family epimerase/isomerase [Gracilimonas sp.]